jgi:hypothetical protein
MKCALHCTLQFLLEIFISPTNIERDTLETPVGPHVNRHFYLILATLSMCQKFSVSFLISDFLKIHQLFRVYRQMYEASFNGAGLRTRLK